jgi:hypothetical protein
MSVKKAAQGLIQKGKVSEGLLNMVEMAFRAYDPCFGCATHSLPGQMPLEVSIATQKSASAHDVSLPTALAFGRQAGAELPDDKDVALLGIEAQDLVNFSEQCTPAVAAAIPRAVREVLQILESMQGEQVS